MSERRRPYPRRWSRGMSFRDQVQRKRGEAASFYPTVLHHFTCWIACPRRGEPGRPRLAHKKYSFPAFTRPFRR